jgi:hypothetical protein
MRVLAVLPLKIDGMEQAGVKGLSSELGLPGIRGVSMRVMARAIAIGH